MSFKDQITNSEEKIDAGFSFIFLFLVTFAVPNRRNKQERQKKNYENIKLIAV